MKHSSPVYPSARVHSFARILVDRCDRGPRHSLACYYQSCRLVPVTTCFPSNLHSSSTSLAWQAPRSCPPPTIHTTILSIPSALFPPPSTRSRPCAGGHVLLRARNACLVSLLDVQFIPGSKAPIPSPEFGGNVRLERSLTTGASHALPLVRPAGGEPLPRSSVPPTDMRIRGTVQQMRKWWSEERGNGQSSSDGGITSFRILGNDVGGGTIGLLEECDDVGRAPATSSVLQVQVQTCTCSLHLKRACGGEWPMADRGVSDGCIHIQHEVCTGMS